MLSFYRTQMNYVKAKGFESLNICLAHLVELRFFFQLLWHIAAKMAWYLLTLHISNVK